MRVFHDSRVRSALLAAMATLFLLGTAALAAQKPSPSPSASPSDTVSASPTESPEASPSASPESSPAAPIVLGSPSADPDAHGDCVSKVARDKTAEATDHHGDKNHGAAVSQAAQSCPKDSNEAATDQETPEASPSPEDSEAPDPDDTPDPAESPEPAETPGD